MEPRVPKSPKSHLWTSKHLEFSLFYSTVNMRHGEVRWLREAFKRTPSLSLIELLVNLIIRFCKFHIIQQVTTCKVEWYYNVRSASLQRLPLTVTPLNRKTRAPSPSNNTNPSQHVNGDCSVKLSRRSSSLCINMDGLWSQHSSTHHFLSLLPLLYIHSVHFSIDLDY